MATSLLIPVLMVALVAMICLSDVHGERDDDAMSNKEIQSRLQVLTNEVKRLKEDVKELKRADNEKDPSSNETVTETEIDPNVLKIIAVSRQTLSDGNVCFTVRYSGSPNITAERAWWYCGWTSYTRLNETKMDRDTNLPENVWESSVITQPKNKTYVMLTVGVRKQWVNLYLRNDVGEDTAEKNIELPLLKLIPDGDIVYEPGHNVTFEIVHPVIRRSGPSNDNLPSSEFRNEYYLVKPGDSKLTTPFNVDVEEMKNFLPTPTENKFMDTTELTIELNTAELQYSGVFSFTLGINSQTGLAARIEKGTEKVLRPSTQRGPFPEGSFFDSYIRMEPPAPNGIYEKFCGYGKSCILGCDFMGSDLTNLELFKTVDEETTKEEIQVIGDDMANPYRLSGMFTLKPQHGDTSPVTFTCLATNAQGGSKTVKHVYTFGTDIEFIKDETSLEKFDNGTAKITCTVRASPRANLTINVDYSPAPQHVEFMTGDVTRATATSDHVGEWTWYSCTASTEYKSEDYFFQ